MHMYSTYVGIDCCKNFHQVAMILPESDKALEWREPNTRQGKRRLIKQLKSKAKGEIAVCYEAGPCGYVLKRELEEAGIPCKVVAPSLIPKKPGERVKTDKRDAKKLAELDRAGLLTEVIAPTKEEEGIRALCRCRGQAREDLMRVRHQLSKYLLDIGMIYADKAWTKRHRAWLKAIKFSEGGYQYALDDQLLAVERAEERVKGLDEKILEISEREPYREVVGRLRCLRGIDTLSAMIIITELYQFGRFSSPRELMSYLGLVPSEYSSGESQQRGKITKTGNRHVRRILVEASKHYRHQPRVGAQLKKRRMGQPGWVISIAEKAQFRLHRRYWHLMLAGKHANKAGVAVARELVGFIWALIHPEAVPLKIEEESDKILAEEKTSAGRRRSDKGQKRDLRRGRLS